MDIEKYLYELADVDDRIKLGIMSDMKNQCADDGYQIEYVGPSAERAEDNIYVILVKDTTYDTYSVWLYNANHQQIVFDGIYDVDLEVAAQYFLNAVE